MGKEKRGDKRGSEREKDNIKGQRNWERKRDIEKMKKETQINKKKNCLTETAQISEKVKRSKRIREIERGEKKGIRDER